MVGPLFLDPGASVLLHAGMLIGLVTLSAVFSAAEAALISAPGHRRRAERVAQRGRSLQRLLAHPNRVYVTVLVGNYLVNISVAVVTVSLTISLLGGATLTTILVAIGATAAVLLTLGEFVPRAAATVDPERTADIVAPVLVVVQFVLYPFVRFFERFSASTMRIFGAPLERRVLLDEQELMHMVEMGAAQGILEKEEEEMISAVIEFGETATGDIMVPRTDMVVVADDTPLEDIVEVLRETGFSRVPIFHDDIDTIIGIVYGKDLLLALHEGKKGSARDIMRQALFVPETVHLDEVLREMRGRRLHIAIVHDEFGGTAGLVTLEDILEEIVGDIFDEYDQRINEAVQWVNEAEAIIDARVDVEEVNEALGTAIPEEEAYETLGGYLFHELGRPGRTGEVVDRENVTFKLERVANRRILTVRAKLKSPPLPREGAFDGPVDP